MPDHIITDSYQTKSLLDNYVVRELRRQTPSGFSLSLYLLR